MQIFVFENRQDEIFVFDCRIWLYLTNIFQTHFSFLHSTAVEIYNPPKFLLSCSVPQSAWIMGCTENMITGYWRLYMYHLSINKNIYFVFGTASWALTSWTIQIFSRFTVECWCESRSNVASSVDSENFGQMPKVWNTQPPPLFP